jgi:hypothetical protein
MKKITPASKLKIPMKSSCVIVLDNLGAWKLIGTILIGEGARYP